MTQRSILITGCSSGIGYDCAHTLHKRGWRVFATCRQQSDCDRLISEGLESFRLDYADEQSIKDAVAETFKRTGGTLDALYNNGAIATPALVLDLPRAALREIFEINLFGYFDLINQIMPTMVKQGHGRIINCSSVLGFAAMRARGAYNSTKFAMEGMTDTLRLESRRHGVHISLIEPGSTTTEIRKNSQKHFEKWIDWKNSPRRGFYEKVFLPRLYDDSGKIEIGEVPPANVTKKLIHALESKRPHPRYYVNTFTHITGFLKRVLPTRMLDSLLARL